MRMLDLWKNLSVVTETYKPLLAFMETIGVNSKIRDSHSLPDISDKV